MQNNVKGNKQIFLCTASLSDKSDTDFIGIAEKIAKAAGLTPLDWSVYHYPKQGDSYHWFLGESHVQLDFYPEYKLVEITLVSCQPFEINKIIYEIDCAYWWIKNYSVIKKDREHQWK